MIKHYVKIVVVLSALGIGGSDIMDIPLPSKEKIEETPTNVLKAWLTVFPNPTYRLIIYELSQRTDYQKHKPKKIGRPRTNCLICCEKLNDKINLCKTCASLQKKWKIESQNKKLKRR